MVIGDGSLAVTTARAIVDGSGRDQGVSIVVPNGVSTRVRVLLIDPVHGIAVLESDTTGSALPVARSIRAGETLRVVGERRSITVVASDGSITLGYPVSAMREGTPLVNERGELVALDIEQYVGRGLDPESVLGPENGNAVRAHFGILEKSLANG